MLLYENLAGSHARWLMNDLPYIIVFVIITVGNTNCCCGRFIGKMLYSWRVLIGCLLLKVGRLIVYVVAIGSLR
jgi:hypothetical protein